MMDVFVSFSFRRNRNRDITFGFVRYKCKYEMVKAIQYGNNRKIDGWIIRVKEAIYGWNERRLRKSDQIHDRGKNSAMTTKYGGGSRGPSGYRSYSDVVVGKGDRGVEQSKMMENVLCGNPNCSAKEMVVKEHPKEVSLETDIPSDDMKWLQRSAIGHVRDFSEVKKMFESLVVAGIDCQLCPMGDLAPWKNSLGHKKLAIWITLEDVPLQIWHEKFFMSIGNSWGDFVRLDDCTRVKYKFDVARFLVIVESKLKIPSSVSVKVRDHNFKVSVTLKDPESLFMSSHADSVSMDSGEEDEPVRSNQFYSPKRGKNDGMKSNL
ncbi:hypothetical protein DITRI_Ditri02bG0052800 [Diplodiscus trichospermus]